MTAAAGSTLLHEVAKRILARYLKSKGYGDVVITKAMLDGAGAIDLTYSSGGSRIGVKIKADAYYGTDPHMIARRDLTYYRPETGSYGLEAIADTFSRQPGWVQRSRADELFYYRLVLSQSEEEIAALMQEPDDVFFSEIKVERDDLRILPMPALRQWFETSGERFMPRPVQAEGRTAWYRIIPESEVESGVQGVRKVGPVFASVARG